MKHGSFIRGCNRLLHYIMTMKDLNGLGGLIALLFLSASLQLRAQPAAAPGMTDITPQNVLNVMQRVADWQLANPSGHKPTDWTQGAGYAGFMALAGISGDPKYRVAMVSMADANGWQLGPRHYHADDQCVGQTYAELYFLYRDPKMIAPMRERFDDLLAHPSDVTSLEFTQPNHQATELWSWCDSLFMAPPVFMRLFAATHERVYLDYVDEYWWKTSDFLYDPTERLYYRDSTYFKKREPNGQKVFWARGEGWVLAGLARVLDYVPQDDPVRPRYEAQFRAMAARVLELQRPDGLWAASLLDPGICQPADETSGSGFFCFAFAWGVNHGLLDRAVYAPAAWRAWAGLLGDLSPDGRLSHVQPIGAAPANFPADSTVPYGVGAFLLAGTELYRM